MFRIELEDPDDPMGMPASISFPSKGYLYDWIDRHMVRGEVTHVEVWKD